MSNLTELQMKTAELLPEIYMLFAEPLSKHTSFKIGGPAEVMVFPKSADELSQILKVSAFLDCRPVILGAGTNILAPDSGIPGIVICMRDMDAGIKRISDTEICVPGGMSMARAAVFAAGQGLSGMEFAHGIPGSVGGGVYMNAGAYGGELSDICKSVEVMDLAGSLRWISKEEMEFSYRHSRLEREPAIVVSAVFSLVSKPEKEIREKMQELMAKRRATQPLDMPSAGSAFKRPTGGYAGALIEQAGLKGFRVGGAAISEKHAGFAVNLGNATAEDVRSLLRQVSDTVFENTGIRLEPEVRIWNG